MLKSYEVSAQQPGYYEAIVAPLGRDILRDAYLEWIPTITDINQREEMLTHVEALEENLGDLSITGLPSFMKQVEGLLTDYSATTQNLPALVTFGQDFADVLRGMRHERYARGAAAKVLADALKRSRIDLELTHEAAALAQQGATPHITIEE